jgi:ankyrin repeat protein
MIRLKDFMKKVILLLLVFCKNAYCKSSPSVNNHQFTQEKQQETQRDQAFTRDQPNLTTFDSVVDLDTTVKEIAHRSANDTVVHNTPLETERFQLISKNSLLSHYPTALTGLGIIGLGTFVYKCLSKPTKRPKPNALLRVRKTINKILGNNQSLKNPAKLKRGAQEINRTHPIFNLSVITNTGSSLATTGMSPIPNFSPPEITINSPHAERVIAFTMESSSDVKPSIEMITAPAASINGSRSPDESGLLLIEAINKEEDINEIKKLIQGCAKIDVKDNYGWTPLHHAAYQNKTDIVNLLLDAGANIHVHDTLDQTPLHLAAWKNLTDIVNVLLNHKADINAKDQYGSTPLHCAVEKSNNRTDTVDLLLKRDADINISDNNNETPLQLATRLKYTDVIISLSR